MKSVALARFCPAETCADSSADGGAATAGAACCNGTGADDTAGAVAVADATKDAYLGFFARFSSTETSLSPYTMTWPVLSSKRDDGAVYGGCAGAAGRAAANGIGIPAGGGACMPGI